MSLGAVARYVLYPLGTNRRPLADWSKEIAIYAYVQCDDVQSDEFARVRFESGGERRRRRRLYAEHLQQDVGRLQHLELSGRMCGRQGQRLRAKRIPNRPQIVQLPSILLL